MWLTPNFSGSDKASAAVCGPLLRSWTKSTQWRGTLYWHQSVPFMILAKAYAEASLAKPLPQRPVFELLAQPDRMIRRLRLNGLLLLRRHPQDKA
jgi:hypothetical protein